jgi:cytochrome c oxidase assembly factor 1
VMFSSLLPKIRTALNTLLMMPIRSFRTQPWSTPPFLRSCIRLQQRRTLIPPPKSSTGPLMSRRPDRALPPVESPWRIWLKTMPIFLAVITASALGFFNYQKSSSSVVSATLYALRTNEVGRRELGDEIYFRDRFPWIWGEMNQLRGRINICYGVKGTKAKGLLRFKSERKTRMGRVSALALMERFYHAWRPLGDYLSRRADSVRLCSTKRRNGVWKQRMGER